MLTSEARISAGRAVIYGYEFKKNEEEVNTSL